MITPLGVGDTDRTRRAKAGPSLGFIMRETIGVLKSKFSQDRRPQTYFECYGISKVLAGTKFAMAHNIRDIPVAFTNNNKNGTTPRTTTRHAGPRFFMS